MSGFDRFIESCLHGEALNSTDHVIPQIFGRLLPRNPLAWNGDEQELLRIFGDLVNTLRIDDQEGPADAGLTFFGQFIDHDVTFDVTSVIGRTIDPRGIRNIRTPNLDMDCVYGDGPEASPHLYGSLNGHEGYLLFGRTDYHLDLSRNGKGTALIGDPRNDENIFVSQIQGAYICLHNLVLSQLHNSGPLENDIRDISMAGTSNDLWSGNARIPVNDFEIARRFVQLHYQNHILNDFLPAFVTHAAIRDAKEGAGYLSDAPLMPVEFSGACFRFGHATVRNSYVLSPGNEILIFGHRGKRTADHQLDLGLFFQSGHHPAQKARPVGLGVAQGLFELPFIHDGLHLPNGTEVPVDLARKLPLRNILRDRYALEMSSGQQAADALHLPRLDLPQVLDDAGISRTPLWFYVLQEADAGGQGRLAGVGGRIVASTLIRILQADPDSIWHAHGFEPLPQLARIGDCFAWVEQNRADLLGHPDLLNG
ncbi:peroxidase family protein [Paracoccus sp. 1_MG-2023]|uniref:peroxidase family protein n=1 Tax=unclassified Paracoccus (in: a-proteobacteria) TaxID=2688777 RepID=UPI001C0967C5|nr:MULTISPECIES: peroxidase family protein [unclassified Paracoccus (in: a-proteobacteria)]MBU2958582.1 hypothetical protein [Paracoccus sp. C2R09]MDO6667575.1 peroxidase family protein [Paracoccus sp. 1_MG-2023]